MSGSTFEWDNSVMRHIYKSFETSMTDLAKSIDKEIKQAEVVPKDSGALEASQRVEAKGEDLAVTYDAPYAARVYYHPEYEFSKEKNANAKGMWLDDILKEDKISKQYADILKGKI